MNSDNVDEDSIDVEALQAQIDLSMSFAQNLVSSWMDPHKFPTSSRRNDLEKELSEYMKRPSRLGVGASIPEGHQSISRETARLKGKLVGSKRPREEDEIVSPKAESDDEHESRVTAIKKKSRSDPFNVVHGKKKKTKATPASPQRGPLPQESIPQSPTRPSFEQKTEVPAVNGFSHLDASPKKKKKRKKVVEGERDESLGFAATSQQDPSRSVRERTPPLLPAISPPPSTPQEDLDEVHKKLMIVSPTTPTSPLLNLCHGESIAADLLKRPLLNLTGPPPSDEESDGNVVGAGTPSTSPKKKRKRRKKKKHYTSGDPLATTPPTASTIPAS